MMYSSTEQFLIQIQKFYTPVILLTCYCTCKLWYTNKMQHTCVFLPGEDCFIFFWTVNVSLTASYEITLLGLSVYPSVHPSLSFLKIGSLFSDIVHSDSWPWYLVTDEARFLKKKTGLKGLFKIRFFAIFSNLVH